MVEGSEMTRRTQHQHPAADAVIGRRTSREADKRLRRAEATIDGLMLALPALRGRVSALREENDRLREQVRRLETSAIR